MIFDDLTAVNCLKVGVLTCVDTIALVELTDDEVVAFVKVGVDDTKAVTLEELNVLALSMS